MYTEDKCSAFTSMGSHELGNDKDKCNLHDPNWTGFVAPQFEKASRFLPEEQKHHQSYTESCK